MLTLTAQADAEDQGPLRDQPIPDEGPPSAEGCACFVLFLLHHVFSRRSHFISFVLYVRTTDGHIR